MTPFTTVSGLAIPLLRPNIDTDVIIRIERLTTGDRSAIGRFAFEALRFRADGTPDPASPLNDERLQGAPILIAGPNFGCGSSREGAVWALAQRGIRCVIGSSFGDIFFSNCFQNGVLAIRLPEKLVADLGHLAQQSHDPFTIDLAGQMLTPPRGAPVAFEIETRRRDALLTGLDDIGLTLTDTARIGDWQAADREARPWVWMHET